MEVRARQTGARPTKKHTLAQHELCHSEGLDQQDQEERAQHQENQCAMHCNVHALQQPLLCRRRTGGVPPSPTTEKRRPKKMKNLAEEQAGGEKVPEEDKGEPGYLPEAEGG